MMKVLWNIINKLKNSFVKRVVVFTPIYTILSVVIICIWRYKLMSETYLLLICSLFFMPIAVILAMGVFWAYIWVKEGLYRTVEVMKEDTIVGMKPVKHRNKKK